jgi:ribonuclease Z
VFRSAAATSAKLHAVDARAFPDPKFAARGDADAADADAAEALEREDAWRAFEERWKRSDGDVAPSPGGSGYGFDASSPPALFHPGQNMLRYTLVPLARAGIDRSEIRRPASPHDVRDALDAASLRASVAAAESRRAKSLAEASRLAAEASARGDPPPTRDPGADVPVPAAIRAMREGDAEIAFLGTGSSMPAKYRNVSGIFLDVPSRGSAFLDCGEGTYGQMVRLYGAEGAAERLLRLRCVWISHIHADHHVGVVTILARRRELLEARGEPDAKPPLVVGPQPLRRFLAAFDAVEPLAYEFADCRAALAEEWDRTEPNGDADGEEGAGARGPGPAAGNRSAYDNSSAHAAIRDACAELGLARLVAAPVVHCAQAYAVSLESEPIRAGVSREKEKEEEDENPNEDGPRNEDEIGRRVEDDEGSDGSFSSVPGWKIVYSGDTRPCESLTELARGATALIHEATFENGMEEDAVKKRHSTTREAIECGLAAGAYRTILTHFSQRYPKAPVFDDHYTERTAVAFDLMRVDMKSLPRLPSLLPAVRALFPDDREEEDEEDKAQEEGAVEL